VTCCGERAISNLHGGSCGFVHNAAKEIVLVWGIGGFEGEGEVGEHYREVVLGGRDGVVF
jgi:hypothetical protein